MRNGRAYVEDTMTYWNHEQRTKLQSAIRWMVNDSLICFKFQFEFSVVDVTILFYCDDRQYA